MFSGLDDVDWSSLHHAYGTAEEVPGLLRAMASPDAEVREKALSSFSNAVHHQGDVTACTTAAVPFLLELARTSDLPDRAAIVSLLVSIGTNAVERYDDLYVDYGGAESNHALAADLIRHQADKFIAFTVASDHRLRRAAIPALAQFIDDAPVPSNSCRTVSGARNGLWSGCCSSRRWRSWPCACRPPSPKPSPGSTPSPQMSPRNQRPGWRPWRSAPAALRNGSVRT